MGRQDISGPGVAGLIFGSSWVGGVASLHVAMQRCNDATRATIAMTATRAMQAGEWSCNRATCNDLAPRDGRPLPEHVDVERTIRPAGGGMGRLLLRA